MNRVIVRILSAVAGACAGLVAVLGPLNFLANQLQEGQSAKQYGGHLSVWGAIGGSLTVLFFALLFGIIAYALIRFSIRGRGRTPSHLA